MAKLGSLLFVGVVAVAAIAVVVQAGKNSGTPSQSTNECATSLKAVPQGSQLLATYDVNQTGQLDAEAPVALGVKVVSTGNDVTITTDDGVKIVLRPVATTPTLVVLNQGSKVVAKWPGLRGGTHTCTVELANGSSQGISEPRRGIELYAVSGG